MQKILYDIYNILVYKYKIYKFGGHYEKNFRNISVNACSIGNCIGRIGCIEGYKI